MAEDSCKRSVVDGLVFGLVSVSTERELRSYTKSTYTARYPYPSSAMSPAHRTQLVHTDDVSLFYHGDRLVSLCNRRRVLYPATVRIPRRGSLRTDIPQPTYATLVLRRNYGYRPHTSAVYVRQLVQLPSRSHSLPTEETRAADTSPLEDAARPAGSGPGRDVTHVNPSRRLDSLQRNALACRANPASWTRSNLLTQCLSDTPSPVFFRAIESGALGCSAVASKTYLGIRSVALSFSWLHCSRWGSRTSRHPAQRRRLPT